MWAFDDQDDKIESLYVAVLTKHKMHQRTVLSRPVPYTRNF